MLRRLAHKVPAPLRSRVRARFEPALIREGDAAPEWVLRGHDGRWHQPIDGWALLVFYPGDRTKGCSLQLADVESHANTLRDLGVRPFGINPADVASHAAFASDLALSFPLLSDPGGEVCKAYGSWMQLPLVSPEVVRTVYLVNPHRKVRLANRGSPSIAAIVRSVEALQQVTRAGM